MISARDRLKQLDYQADVIRRKMMTPMSDAEFQRLHALYNEILDQQNETVQRMVLAQMEADRNEN